MRRHLLALAVLLSATSLQGAKNAPSFSASLMAGNKISLKETLKPGRLLLLSFWASWCTPCIEELKSVSEKIKKDPMMPLDLLTINVDTSETSSDVKPTLKLYSFDFPVILDPKHQIFAKYMDQKELPFSVLVNGQGEIVASFKGYSETMFEEIKAHAPKTN